MNILCLWNKTLIPTSPSLLPPTEFLQTHHNNRQNPPTTKPMHDRNTCTMLWKHAIILQPFSECAVHNSVVLYTILILIEWVSSRGGVSRALVWNADSDGLWTVSGDTAPPRKSIHIFQFLPNFNVTSTKASQLNKDIPFFSVCKG